ncbi:thiol peroxidase, atypical 2-Cys peroxiredoxin [Clostridium cavendishii DSM 21758]|uniref:Thiol peroxidase, atypical 2-Cys peroxiredoxin n=1 Tax=Clostridium cavendishii DSM 21758 TaxID=1121302 RepID=A0A1M6KB54_9CLOT|nr:thiol peroxidase [Clostridium cavendishii]SHJ56150.1 thiol peroxidase, atypical 2-Cys peroxiredoxin [Clostridium cavendishii DSM 21758]
MKIKFQGNEVNLLGTQVKVGEKIKDFKVVNNDLSELTLKDTKGVRIFLAVPSVDTPVCDLEVVTFNNKIKELQDVNCYTVSMDLPFAQARWCQAKSISNVKVVSDYKDRSFSEATGTYIKELGLLTRAAFVVNSENKLVYVEYLDEITNQPKFDEILEAAKMAK